MQGDSSLFILYDAFRSLYRTVLLLFINYSNSLIATVFLYFNVSIYFNKIVDIYLSYIFY